jgi:hypothetical protein
LILDDFLHRLFAVEYFEQVLGIVLELQVVQLLQ